MPSGGASGVAGVTGPAVGESAAVDGFGFACVKAAVGRARNATAPLKNVGKAFIQYNNRV